MIDGVLERTWRIGTILQFGVVQVKAYQMLMSLCVIDTLIRIWGDPCYHAVPAADGSPITLPSDTAVLISAQSIDTQVIGLEYRQIIKRCRFDRLRERERARESRESLLWKVVRRADAWCFFRPPSVFVLTSPSFGGISS